MKKAHVKNTGAFWGRGLSAAMMGAILLASPVTAQTMPDYRGDNPPTGRAPMPRENMPDQNGDIIAPEDGEYNNAQSDGLTYYRPLDQAYAFVEAIGNSPPDFNFRFDGNDAWGWESQSGDIMLMERDGARTIQYFFEPGDDAPYLVRTDAQSFAYANDGLFAAYDSRGAVVDSASNDQQAEDFFHRGVAMHEAASDKSGNWNDSVARDWSSSVAIDYTMDSWGGWNGWWRSYPGWQSYYDWDTYYSYDRGWRGDYGRNFYNWRRRGHQGRPPVRPTRPPITRPIPGHPGGPIAGGERPNYGRPNGGGWRGDRWQNGTNRPRPDGQQRPNRPGWRPDGSVGDGNQPPMTIPPGHDVNAGTRPNWQRPEGQRPDDQRPNWQRPEGQRPDGQRPNWQRPEGQRPDGQRPNWQRPEGQRPEGQRPHGQRPNWQRPEGQRPQTPRPETSRPQVQRPEGHGSPSPDRAWRVAMTRRQPAEPPRPPMEQPQSHPRMERPQMERAQMERAQPRAQMERPQSHAPVERPAPQPAPRTESPRDSGHGHNPNTRIE